MNPLTTSEQTPENTVYMPGAIYVNCPHGRLDKIPRHSHRFEEYNLKAHLRCKVCGLLKEREQTTPQVADA